MKTSVVLLFGGRSGEHGISCVTAGGILGSIDRDRYDVLAVGITREGRMVHVSDDPAAWSMVGGKAPEIEDEGPEVLLPARAAAAEDRPVLRCLREGRVEPLGAFDVVFPVLHGPYGEDGTIQGALELLDIPYVGSGVLASALCMDKGSTKVALAAVGIPTTRGTVIHEDRWAREARYLTDTVEGTLNLPWFVKPARAGSSLGVSRVDDRSELRGALELAFAQDPRVLIEEGVAGREVECGVLQAEPGREPRTTVPGEVRVGADLEFYDYEAKYFGKGTVEIEVPARLSDAVLEEARHVAARAFTALRLEGLARVDLFVTADGSVIVNEVNTMPGFTPYSMFPVLWQNMGLTYPDLISDLVEQARNRTHGLR